MELKDCDKNIQQKIDTKSSPGIRKQFLQRPFHARRSKGLQNTACGRGERKSKARKEGILPHDTIDPTVVSERPSLWDRNDPGRCRLPQGRFCPRIDAVEGMYGAADIVNKECQTSFKKWTSQCEAQPEKVVS